MALPAIRRGESLSLLVQSNELTEKVDYDRVVEERRLGRRSITPIRLVVWSH